MKEKDKGNIEEKFAALKEERDEYLAGWQRAKADFANLKKQSFKAAQELADSAKINMVMTLLPVLDAFRESEKNNIDGFSNIYSLFVRALDDEGFTIIKAQAGEDFNPEIHEALAGEGSLIDEVFQYGCKYKDKVIRPVKVKVKE